MAPTGDARKSDRTPIWVWVVLGFPVICLLIMAATTPNRNVMTVSFLGPLPSDDVKLVAWLESQTGISGIRVERKSNAVEIRYRTRLFARNGKSFLLPPWSELGYGLPSNFTFRVSPGWLPGL